MISIEGQLLPLEVFGCARADKPIPGVSPSTGQPRLPRRRLQSPMSTFAGCSGEILDWGSGLATCGNTFVGARRPIDELNARSYELWVH